MAEHDLIGDYLRRLRDRLGRGAGTDDAIAEVSDHLHEAMASEVARGQTPEGAALAVVQRFGPADEVARRLRESRSTLPGRWRRPTGALGLLTALLLTGSMTVSVYLSVHGLLPSRPNAEKLNAALLLAGLAALLSFLVIQSARTSTARRAITVVVAGSAIALAAFPVLGTLEFETILYPDQRYLTMATLYRSGVGPWLWPLTSATLLAVCLALLLPAWAGVVDDSRAARWTFGIGATLLFAAGAVRILVQLFFTDGDWGTGYAVASWIIAFLPLPVIMGLIGLSVPLLRSSSSSLRTATG